ncbi:antibiotic biosynthesis monooxygenase [Mucilaginibacter daejeonensis]|uniref:putative quinol monooxygenase n=1 Tax=Mucilaginibacter daejeonensis TaxID=398049 RepID=UPI001D17A010|nr:putative quinol monooxygenase [Mucilaginibacter daejeonensis]UEG52628.1 antibiotic biosynthesis monooxygenase [Mucilaginibacter daejeonensis]
MSVRSIAILHCHADAEEAFELELKKLVEASASDEGYIKYEIFQYQDKPYKYVLLDEWRDAEAFEAHQSTAHYKHFMRVVPVLLEQPLEFHYVSHLV